MSQKYDKDFKIQTVKMIQEQGKSVAQAARELGIAENTLYRWISAYKQDPVNTCNRQVPLNKNR
jgi:transposase